jgi:hypothetical protein
MQQHCMNQFISVQATFHQDFNFTSCSHLRRLVRSGMTVRRIDQLDTVERKIACDCSGSNFSDWSDEYRYYQTTLRCIERTR